MRNIKILSIMIGIVVVAFAAVCVSAVFSVTDINVEYSVYTSREVQKAKAVVDGYKGKNLLFLNVDELKDELLEKTSLRVASISKKYPNAIEIKLIERPEVYAVKYSDGYYVLDDEFTVVGLRSDAKNSFDGIDNLVVEFPLTVEDEQNVKLKTRFSPSNTALFASIENMLSAFPSPRDYVKRITVEEKEVDTNYYVFFEMAEGVSIEIRKALTRPQDKIAAGREKYFSLADADRLSGKITVYELDGGLVRAVYTTNE